MKNALLLLAITLTSHCAGAQCSSSSSQLETAASQSPVVNTDHYYYIQNVNSGYLLNLIGGECAWGSTTDGQFQQYRSVQEGGDNELFAFVPTGSPSTYAIRIRSSNKVIDDPLQNIGNAQWLQQYDYYATPNQQWHLEPIDTRRGYFKIVNVQSNMALDVHGYPGDEAKHEGAGVQQFKSSDTPNQLWKLADSGTSINTPPLPYGCPQSYRVKLTIDDIKAWYPASDGGPINGNDSIWLAAGVAQMGGNPASAIRAKVVGAMFKGDSKQTDVEPVSPSVGWHDRLRYAWVLVNVSEDKEALGTARNIVYQMLQSAGGFDFNDRWKSALRVDVAHDATYTPPGCDGIVLAWAGTVQASDFGNPGLGPVPVGNVYRPVTHRDQPAGEYTDNNGKMPHGPNASCQSSRYSVKFHLTNI